jgi:hypothetical protein
MFEAQIIRGGMEIYSPWFERRGDYVRATLEVVDLSASGMTMQVFTKNTEDTSNGVDADSGTIITLTAAGRTTAEWGPAGDLGLKELVRYKFVSLDEEEADWTLFRTLAPVWFDAVKP